MEKTELARLKELAEKATQYTEHTIPLIRDCDSHWALELPTRDDMEFHAAASPVAILALLADYERLEKEADWLASQLEARDIADHYEDCLSIADMKDQTDWRKAAQEMVKENFQ